MSKTAKNLIVILALITVALAGYLMFIQPSASLNFETSDTVLENMRADSQLFIERRQQLQTVRLDTAIFSDDRFRNLQSFDEPIVEQSVGRDNLFVAPGG